MSLGLQALLALAPILLAGILLVGFRVPAKRAMPAAYLAAVMVALWPYLWPDPVGRFAEHLRYIGLRAGYTRAESLAPALQAVALTTPPAFLAFFAVGLAPCLRRAFRKAPRDRLRRQRPATRGCIHRTAARSP